MRILSRCSSYLYWGRSGSRLDLELRRFVWHLLLLVVAQIKNVRNVRLLNVLGNPRLIEVQLLPQLASVSDDASGCDALRMHPQINNRPALVRSTCEMLKASYSDFP